MRRRCARTSISNTSESSVSDIITAGFPQIGQISDSSGKRNELFLDGQVGIVAPTVAGMTGLRAAFLAVAVASSGSNKSLERSPCSRLLRLAAKEFVLQGADLTARLVKLFLQLLDAFDGLGMLAFPIAHFPAKIGPQLLQRPFQTLHGRAVGAGNQSLRRLVRKVQKRGIHRATL